MKLRGSSIRVCKTHTCRGTHSRRVFISDTMGMIGICRYVFVLLSQATPMTPSGVLCILYKLTTSAPSLSDTHTGCNRSTRSPLGSCTYSPSDWQRWSPPTPKTETLLTLPPVIVHTVYMSDRINYLSLQGCGECVVCLFLCVCMDVGQISPCACVI